MVDEWWKYWHARHVLYSAIKQLDRVLVRSRVCNRHMIGFVPSNWVLSETLTVFVVDDYQGFSVLQSSFHDSWVDATASTMRTDVRYVESRCFGAFPWPAHCDRKEMEASGRRFYESRQSVVIERRGLTKTYTCFHDAHETSADIQKLRQLHVEMDNAVATAYGWTNLGLGHGFHETKQGMRYTISESARREVLARLLKLNHERYAEEVKQGLHEKKKSKTTKGKKGTNLGTSAGPGLFEIEEDT